MMEKKVLLLAALGVGLWWISRKYNNYETENYIMTGDEGAFDKVGDFIKTSFDSAISYGQEDLGMNFSIQLLDYLKSWEKFEPRPYYASEAERLRGWKTIGYGHRIIAGDGFDDETVLTETEALGVLLNDIGSKQLLVKKLVKIPLSQNQFDALVSFTFNGGTISNVAKTVNAGGDVPAHMAKYRGQTYPDGSYKIITGLVRRRAADNRIWNDAIYRKD